MAPADHGFEIRLQEKHLCTDDFTELSGHVRTLWQLAMFQKFCVDSCQRLEGLAFLAFDALFESPDERK